MSESRLSQQLKVLLTGLAKKKIDAGDKFYCGNVSLKDDFDRPSLLPEDVAEIVFGSTIALSDAVMAHLGMGDTGYGFDLGSPNPILPVDVWQKENRAFLQIAPFVTEVFESEVYRLRSDLTEVYRLVGSVYGFDVDYTPQPVEQPAQKPVNELVSGLEQDTSHGLNE